MRSALLTLCLAFGMSASAQWAVQGEMGYTLSYERTPTKAMAISSIDGSVALVVNNTQAIHGILIMSIDGEDFTLFDTEVTYSSEGVAAVIISKDISREPWFRSFLNGAIVEILGKGDIRTYSLSNVTNVYNQIK